MTFIDPIEFAQGVSHKPFVAFDVETTGLDSMQDRIVEIGAVKVGGGIVLGRYSQLIKPIGLGMSEEASELTGITNEMLEGMPSVDKALRDFLSFVGQLPLVAHNAKFDAEFIEAEAIRCGLYMAERLEYVDTLRLARKAWSKDQVQNYKLGTLADYVGHSRQAAHRAVDDAEAVYAVLMQASKKLF